MGVPTPGNIVRIIDNEGNEAPIGEVGDIAVHKSSPNFYLKNIIKNPSAHKLHSVGIGILQVIKQNVMKTVTFGLKAVGMT